MTKLLALGNYGALRSTENALKYGYEQCGVTVVPMEQSAVPDSPTFLADTRRGGYDAVTYVRSHTRTALGRARGESNAQWTTVWRQLEAAGIRTFATHLDVFCGVQRHELTWDDPMFTVGTIFTPDPLLAEQIESEHTSHVWLPPAADIRNGDLPGEPIAGLAGKVVFVGSRYGTPEKHPEYRWRSTLLDWLHQNYGISLYWYGGGSSLGVLRGKAVWDVYASDCVVVGDSCFAGERPAYWSDRAPESLGHGALFTHPDVEGIQEAFPGMHCYTAGDLDSLKQSIEGNLVDLAEDPLLVRTERDALRAHVREHHTYVHRARTILDTLGLDHD